MPIYEYKCTKCGHQLEQLQKINDAPLLHCPKCNNDTLDRLISPVGFQLKGTGWYITDFKDKKTNATSEPNSHQSTALEQKVETSDKNNKAGSTPKSADPIANSLAKKQN